LLSRPIRGLRALRVPQVGAKHHFRGFCCAIQEARHQCVSNGETEVETVGDPGDQRARRRKAARERLVDMPAVRART